MIGTFIQLTEDEFDDRYQLVPNHLNPNASWACGENGGCLFETYGEELEFVRRQDPNRIWTFVDGDDGDQYVVSGYHLVNRIGYLISTEAVPEGTEIEVRICSPSDDEPETPAAESTAELLSQIALEHLHIPTLETRGSDRLDFHDLSVWGVNDALKSAYEAGQRRAVTKLLAVLNRCAVLLADHDEQDGEEGDVYREVIAAIESATTPGAGQ